MKRLIVALAMAGAFLMPVAPAAAQVQVDPDVGVLILTARGLGIKFEYDTSICAGNFRLMGYFMPADGTVAICLKNAKASLVSPLQVLRHELIHVAQECLGGPLVDEDYSSTVVLPASYPLSQHRREAEARVLADNLSELDVARTLAIACRNPQR
jgi:hypothetical protein